MKNINKQEKVTTLVKTDYDEFKSLSFFQKQYDKAQEMLREVSEFYKSFLNSKLIRASELHLTPNVKIHYPQHLYVKEDNGEVKKIWQERYNSPSFCSPSWHAINEDDRDWGTAFEFIFMPNIVDLHKIKFKDPYHKAGDTFQRWGRICQYSGYVYDCEDIKDFTKEDIDKVNDALVQECKKSDVEWLNKIGNRYPIGCKTDYFFIMFPNGYIVPFGPEQILKYINIKWAKDKQYLIAEWKYKRYYATQEKMSYYANISEITIKHYFEASTNNYVGISVNDRDISREPISWSRYKNYKWVDVYPWDKNY